MSEELHLIIELAKNTKEAVDAIVKRLNEHTDQLKAAEDRIKALEEERDKWHFLRDKEETRLSNLEEALNKHLMEERERNQP